jgi:UDP-glucose 4-epimerase
MITGAAGFIGSNLVRDCLNRGWDVTGVDNLSNGHKEFLPASSDKFRFWHNDFVDESVLVPIRSSKFDVVFHLAAIPRVSYSCEHPLETHDVNVTKTLELIEACKGRVKRFVFASSSSVYGGADKLPTHESTTKNPKSPYALQKSQIEDYLTLYHELYGLESVSLRFFNVFGPGQVSGSAYATAISAWLDAIKRGKPMRSDGDGTQSRDLCYVDNITDACIKAAETSTPLQAKRFNVACGERTSNKDILAYLLMRYPGSSCVSAPWRAGDVMHTQAQVNSALWTFGYLPLVHAWDGIGRTCDWFDKNWNWVKDLKVSI